MIVAALDFFSEKGTFLTSTRLNINTLYFRWRYILSEIATIDNYHSVTFG